MPKIDISYGELADRFSILRVKAERLPAEKASEIQVEISEISVAHPELSTVPLSGFVDRLYKLNCVLWSAVAECRMYVSSGSHVRRFLDASSTVVRLNDERFKIKSTVDSVMPGGHRELKEI